MKIICFKTKVSWRGTQSPMSEEEEIIKKGWYCEISFSHCTSWQWLNGKYGAALLPDSVSRATVQFCRCAGVHLYISVFTVLARFSCLLHRALPFVSGLLWSVRGLTICISIGSMTQIRPSKSKSYCACKFSDWKFCAEDFKKCKNFFKLCHFFVKVPVSPILRSKVHILLGLHVCNF